MTRNLNQSGIRLLGTVLLIINLLATPAFSQDDQTPAKGNKSLVSNYLDAAIRSIKSGCEAGKLYAQADAIAAELARTVAEARAEAAQAQKNSEDIRELIESLKMLNPPNMGVDADELLELYSKTLESCERSAQLVIQYADIAESEATLSSVDRVAKFKAYAEAAGIDYTEQNRVVKAGNKALERAQDWIVRRDEYWAAIENPEAAARLERERVAAREREAAAFRAAREREAAAFRARMDALDAEADALDAEAKDSN